MELRLAVKAPRSMNSVRMLIKNAELHGSLAHCSSSGWNLALPGVKGEPSPVTEGDLEKYLCALQAVDLGRKKTETGPGKPTDVL